MNPPRLDEYAAVVIALPLVTVAVVGAVVVTRAARLWHRVVEVAR